MALVLMSQAQAAKPALPDNSIPLSELIGQTTPIDLNGSEIIYPVFIPLTQRMVVQDVELHLEYVNSIALIGARSQMIVKLNDEVVAQIPLNPNRPEGIADIRLPSKRFEPGYNKLTFHVVQHYTYDCEDPDAPELWTQIDSHKSYVRYEGLLKRLKPKLSELPQLLDERWVGDYELNMVTPSLPDSDSARWAALAAQSAAIHLEYKPPLIHHEILKTFSQPSTARLQAYRFPGLDQSHMVGRDTIMVGTQSDLQRALGSKWSATVRGPYLGVFALDEDPRHFLLVVSGSNASDVDAAARILGYLNFPLPDQATANFPGLTVDHLHSFAAPPLVSQNSTYRLYDFGYESSTIRGAQGGMVDIDVMLPPNTYVAETSRVKLNL
ncbi:MAG: cellulose biosynthesis cyclic di-GMP-binding regulatory protein BcsB, partial [Oceanobacter sp.]